MVIAQGEEDALRLSWTIPGGTGRSAGMANAFGALGADPGSIALNPAGFGLYRTSEISITPGFEVNDSRSTYYFTRASDTQSRFFMNNMALVLHNPSEKGGAWRSSTFGIIYDRQATYHWRKAAAGERINSSVVERFVNEANGTPSRDLFGFFPWSSGVAWEAFAIDPLDTLAHTYQGAMPLGSAMRHEHTVVSSGATSNTGIFFGANYMDQLYIGGSIGVVGTRYRRTTTQFESTMDEELELNDLSFREELNTTGNGIDIKLGIIGRLSDRVRLGAAFHGPTWLQMTDLFSTSMRTRFRDGASYSANSPEGTFSYRVTTPWRVLFSAAYVAGANGLVSVDYQYSDFRNMRLRPASNLLQVYDFAVENAAIANSFRAVHSVRIGTEWRAGSWYFRGGWGIWPDPYVEQDVRHGLSMKNYAGGIGYRTDHFAIDLGLNYLQRSSPNYPYDPALVDPIFEDNGTYRAMLTFSLRP
jgi:hypothetical protein